MKTIMTKEELVQAIRNTQVDIAQDLRYADLSGANLSGLYLRGADFSEADLSGANLSNTVLVRAEFICANLRNTDLTNANLNNAYLIDTDLRGANLTNATFHNAHFCNAMLTDVNLDGTDFTGADFKDALISHINMDNAKVDAIREDILEYCEDVVEEYHTIDPVKTLLDHLEQGFIDGQFCHSCMVGTMAKALNKHYQDLKHDAVSIREQWFTAIKFHDTPENNAFSKLTSEWITVWLRQYEENQRKNGNLNEK